MKDNEKNTTKKTAKAQKKRKQNKRHLARISVEHRHRCQSLIMERHGKEYHPSTGKTTAQSAPVKPKREVTLKSYPISKKVKKHIPRRKAFRILCSFPNQVEGAGAAAKLLLLTLLSQALYLLKETALALPLLVLDATAVGTAPVVRALLRAIQGPEQWAGKNWKLKRPWVIYPKNTVRETKPSESIIDYIGGKFKDEYWRKRKFAFPYIASTMVLMPNLPANISKQIQALSPLSMPIAFAKSKLDSPRPILELKDSMLDSYDENGIEILESYAPACYVTTTTFLGWLSRKKKRIKRWKRDIDRFRPVTRRGQFAQKVTDDQTELLCTALALFQQYLYYASEKKKWIKPAKAKKILLRYWRLVLPESAPAEEGSDPTFAYDAQEVFYRFLTEQFIPTYHSQILQAQKGSQETMGLIRDFANNEAKTWFITPRSRFLETYAAWLETANGSPAFDLSTPNIEAAIQRKLQDAGIPLRHETNNPATWRYAFYASEKKEEGGTLACFALPLRELPVQVQTCFRDCFGIAISAADTPTGAEDGQNQSEAVKAL